MSKQLLLGIDAGTTSLKAVLYSSEDGLVAQGSQEYPTSHPYPNWAQQDPEDWWRGLCVVLNRLLAGSRTDPRQIAGIGISCQGPTMLAIDARGRPLYPALIWMDRRSERQSEWLRRTVGDDTITRTNGGRSDPYYVASKLLWFKENEPALYKQTAALVQVNGYIAHRLCGAVSFDVSHGPLTLFFDSRGCTWSEPLIEQMGFDIDKLPPLRRCTDVIGEVTAAAAAETGLAPGTPVVAGMVDGTAAAVEAGLREPGEAVEMTGQSTVLMICSDQPYLGPDLFPLVHAVPGRYLVVGAMVSSGGSLRWFRDELGQAERESAALLGVDPFELLTLEARQSPAGANRLVFLPYMFGERSPIWDTDARGVFFGLSQATKKADMIRAILEGAAFGLRHNVEAAAAEGFRLDRLACVGGGARSALWNQIKADILNRRVCVPAMSTGAPLGDALVAAVGVGIEASLEESLKRVVQIREEFVPRPEVVELYDRLYRVYLELYPALKASFKQLSKVGSTTDHESKSTQ